MNIQKLVKNWSKYQRFTNVDLAEEFSVSEATIRRWIKKEKLVRNADPTKELRNELHTTKLRSDNKASKKQLNVAVKQIQALEAEHEIILDIKNHQVKTKAITSKKSSTSESVAFIVVSDTHLEQQVLPDEVNGLNEYNLAIAESRMNNLFLRGHKLITMAQNDSKIDTVVIPILGDMISGNIHEELAEDNLLGPADAVIFAQRLLASGIEEIANDKTIKKIVVRCHTGNHGRMTHERRNGKNENGLSLETILYHWLADYFRNNKKVTVEVPNSAISYLKVYDTNIRMMHGHSIRYSGGIGGPTIPVNKAIARYDQAHQADLTILGHFHTYFDGGRFLINGSSIGTTAYSLSFGHETPKQTFFLITKAFGKARGKSLVAPIWLD
jgi:hypothetical protein